MDIAFDTQKKLNQLCLQACLKRQDKDTGYIYFDDKDFQKLSTKQVPMLENMAFVLSLFNQKQQDSFFEAEKLLVRLLSYYKEGNFPKYLHEAPSYQNPFVSIWIYPYLYKIKTNFRSYLNKTILKSLSEICDEIKNYAKTIEPYHHLKPLVDAILEKPILELFGSFESAFAVSISGIDKLPLKVKEQEIKFLEKGHIMLSLFDFMHAEAKGEYLPDLLPDHPLHLKLSLFYEPFHKREYPSELFYNKVFRQGLVWQDKKGFEHVLSFDEYLNASKTRFGLELKGNLSLHQEGGIYFPQSMSVTQGGRKGTLLLKNQPILILGLNKSIKVLSTKDLILKYEKRPQELFHEVSSSLKAALSGSFDILIELD